MKPSLTPIARAHRLARRNARVGNVTASQERMVASRQHWRRTAMPAGGLRSWFGVCFARFTETNGPH